uniref:Protein lin-10 n=1 Tax=Haemonchus contortus TaxID=6289 RepID=A0A7I4XXL3_HAECO
MQFQMPFFANPFMSPFMPQQGVPMDGAAAAGANPAMPAFFFSPAQYQEMMQQYFTQMMTANQYGMNMAFPMPFGTTLVRPCSQASQSDGVGETVNGLHELHISSAADREVVNPSNVTCQSDSPSSSGKNSIASGAERVANEVAADSNRSSSEEQGQGKSPCVDSSSEKVSTKSEGEEACETPKKKFERKSSLPTEDEKTSNLIRKQMSEIEKEITRRSQNKNIKKSALPFSAAVNECKPPPKETINQLRSSFNLPEMSTSPAQLQLHMQQSGTNSIPFASPQMAGLPHGMSSPLHTQPMIGAMTQPFPMAQPFPCGQPVIGPFAAAQMPFAAAQFHNRGHNVSHEQLAAAFLPQDQRPSQAEPQSSNSESVTDVTTTSTMSEHVSNVPSGGTIAPPPPPARPVHRRISQSAQPSSSSEWPDENKENGSTEEPVWVLRDSYLKRMQREMKEEEQRDEWNGDANTAASASTTTETPADGEEMETDRLLLSGSTGGSQPPPPSTGHGKKKNSKETMVHEPAVLIEGVLFRARYLGSTQMMCESRGSKAARMAQAQEAVARVKAPEGEIQPSTEIDLFISTEKIMVLNTDLQDILMDHALRTISYIADIGDLVVLMARRMSASSSDEQCNQVDGIKKTPKVICHVFESDEASFIAQSIGQAFQVAYVEFLRANGIDDPSYLRQIDYQEVLNSQELLGDELEMFARKETQKDVVVPKKSGEPLGIVVVESGWGSMLPTVVLAHMNPAGPAARSNQLNIGDQIININGISLVGLPLSAAQTNIKNVKTCTAVRLTVVSTPPVVEVRIRRPDTKYQLGFSVQNGVICSLLRGGIAERGGIRVGHRIIEINNQSVVAVAHDRIVNMLATAIGEIHMKTMPHQYVPPAHRPGHSSVHLIL